VRESVRAGSNQSMKDELANINRARLFHAMSLYPKVLLSMATQKPFAEAGFLKYLEHLADTMPAAVDKRLPSLLVRLLYVSDGGGRLTETATHLILLLKGRETMLKASFDIEQVADELRRYQKFAKPGHPSPHTVQLRQQQGAVRQASSVAKQAFIQAAAGFVRAAEIVVPERVALDVYINRWIDDNVPKNFTPTI
jgi:predicted component of type VI protein secretion system